MRFPLPLPGPPAKAFERALNELDSDGRYWTLCTMYHAISTAVSEAKTSEAGRWRRAAAEKRIKTRKQRGSDSVKVWIA